MLDATRAVRTSTLATAALALVLMCPFDPLRAQEPDDFDPFHWGYAPMFGAGDYRQADATETSVVRVSPSILLREPRVREGPNFGARLLLPFTLGVQDFDDEDLPPGRPSDELEHAGFLPGVELEFPGERFTGRVRGQVGWGTELEGREEAARMAAFGLRTRLAWPDAAGSPALINGLLWAGFDRDSGERRSLLRFTQALEFDVAVPRWQFREQTMHLKPHVLADWYYRPPEWLAFGDEGFGHVETEWQIGLLARRELGFRIFRFEFEGVGVAYRFSEHSEGLRFFLNSVF